MEKIPGPVVVLPAAVRVVKHNTFRDFRKSNVSSESKTDVLCERGGNGQNPGPLVAYVLLHKMLLGLQKRACRARGVRLVVVRAAVRVVKHNTFSDFRKSNASWGSKTDVLRERGGNGDWHGSLVACVLPHKMLLGF